MILDGKVSSEKQMLNDLSRDLLKVAERIQSELNGLTLEELQVESFSQIELAEKAVDGLAHDLSRGEGELTKWHRVLTDYEAAWHQVICGLGERRN